MEPILTIYEIDLNGSDKDKEQIEEYLYTSLRGQGAAYDHIVFCWVTNGSTYTLYGYGWFDA